VVMKSSTFWDITPCSPLKVNWRFWGTCCFHLQGRRVSQARNQHEASSKQSFTCCLLPRRQNYLYIKSASHPVLGAQNEIKHNLISHQNLDPFILLHFCDCNTYSVLCLWIT
jgi:hypothetical protein